MSRKFGSIARATVGVVGGLALAGAGVAAFAAYPDAEDSSDVNVNVAIEAIEPAGALSLSVAGDSTDLAEGAATADYRVFEGTLPDVTVTDTRTEAPEGVYWYVTGQAGSFAGTEGQADITPDHLGWAPAMVTEGNGEVSEGEPVETILDEGDDAVGLEGEELLQLSLDSAEAKAANGAWTANADLTLKTPLDVEAGEYTSVLTLSLFEDTY